MSDQAEIIQRLERIERALVGNDLDPTAPPGLVDRVRSQGTRIDVIEEKHRTVIGWAMAGIGTVAAGAGAAIGGMVIEWLRNPRTPTGGH